MLRDSSHCARANRNVTAAASDHSPMTRAPVTASTMSTLMSRAKRRADTHARRPQYHPPLATATAKTARVSARGMARASDRRPSPTAAPDTASSVCRAAGPAWATRDGASCSSHARMPVSATASAIADAEIRAAS